MALTTLKERLRQSFHGAVAERFDAVFRITVDDESLLFRVSQGTLDFDLPPAARPDATFMFDDVDTAWALLSGRADLFEAFMEGRFRSDGYLIWAFSLTAMFRTTG
jgi:putative sterol carrier protein